jgi:multidrug efflux system membrane fusion protein
LTIPTAAVQRGPDGMFAYVLRSDATVEARPLKVGEESGSVMVVQDGLKEGEKVVTSNQYRLQPGARVETGSAASNARTASADATTAAGGIHSAGQAVR